KTVGMKQLSIAPTDGLLFFTFFPTGALTHSATGFVGIDDNLGGAPLQTSLVDFLLAENLQLVELTRLILNFVASPPFFGFAVNLQAAHNLLESDVILSARKIDVRRLLPGFSGGSFQECLDS